MRHNIINQCASHVYMVIHGSASFLACLLSLLLPEPFLSLDLHESTHGVVEDPQM